MAARCSVPTQLMAGNCEFDVTPDGRRVAAVVDRQEQKPETHLHVLLNVVDEFKRRAAGTK